MMPARWARAATPARIAAGALLLAVGGALTGCAGGVVPAAAPAAVGPTVIPQPAAAPRAEATEAGNNCPYLSTELVAALAGDQRTQLVGSSNTCSFSIGGQFNYQIDVMSNEGDRFDGDRAALFKDATDVAGVGDAAFFRNGTAITVLAARKGDSYFTVTLIPKVADPDVGKPGTGGQPAATADGADAQLLARADTDGDGVIDADKDGNGLVDEGANQRAAAAADADGDGKVDADVAAALAATTGGAKNNAAAGNNANGAKNKANAAGPAPVTDIAGAKARMTDIAKEVAGNL
jgi:hypothetical protein